MLLSHLPAALIFSPFLVSFCLWSAWNRSVITASIRAAFAAVLGSGLAAAYVLPAMMLQDMVQPEHWSIFRPEDNLLFGASASPFRKFLGFAFLLVGAFVAIATHFMIAEGRGRPLIPWIAMAVGVAMIVTPISAGLWKLLPLVERVQFPWRALGILDVAACMILALLLEARILKTRLVLSMGAMAMMLAAGVFLAGRGLLGDAAPFAKPAAVEDALIASRADAPEYLPACRLGQTVAGWARSEHIVTQALAERGAGVLPVFYYPFLALSMDGKSVAARCDSAAGFIAADIPDGATIEIRKVSLPIERAGYAISCASLLVLGAGLLWRRWATPASSWPTRGHGSHPWIGQGTA